MFFKKRKSRQTEPDSKDESTVVETDDEDTEGAYPLIEALKLPEIVPSIVLSDLQDEAKRRDGAVRRLNNLPEGVSGYTVLVATEDDLEKAEFDLTDEAFGNFGLSLRGGFIQSATLSEDIRHGRVVMIPTRDTLSALDEYEKFRQMTYHWGIFPIDITDEDIDSAVVVLDQTVSLTDAMNLAASGEDPQLGQPEEVPEPATPVSEPENDEPAETSDVDAESTTDVDPDDVPEDADTEPESETDAIPESADAENHDEDGSNALFSGTSVANEDEPAPTDEDEGNPEDLDEVDEPYPDDSDSSSDEADMEPTDADPKDFAKALNGFSGRIVGDKSLNLEIDPTTFNDLFASDGPLQFELSETDSDGLLDKTLNEKRREYNGQLEKLHQTHLQTLKHLFFDQMESGIRAIAERLDDANAETDVGVQRQALEKKHAEEADRADAAIIEYRQQLKKDYDKACQDFVDQMAAQAKREYDERHKSEFDQKSSQAELKLEAKIDQNYAEGLRHLNELRKAMAARLFDKTHADVIAGIQTVYEDMLKKESQLRDQLSQNIQDYLHENYAKDVMRREALMKKLNRDKTIAELKADYEEKLDEKKKRISGLQDEADSALKDLEKKHAVYIKSLKLDYESQLQDRKAEIAALNRDMASLRHEYSSLDEKNAEKYRQELKRQRETIDSQNELIRHQEAKASRMKRLSGGLIAAVIVAALLIGSFSTYLFTHSDSKAVAAAPQTTVSQPAPSGTSTDVSTADTSSSSVSSPVDGYVATSKSHKSLIVKYAKSYAEGDQIPVIGAMNKQTSSSVTVTKVSGKTVTVKDDSGETYTFNAID